MDDNLAKKLMQNVKATEARSQEKETWTGLYIGRLEQLMQLFNGVTWDGDLVDKTSRTELMRAGLATKQDGYNLITRKGVKYLYRLGIVYP